MLSDRILGLSVTRNSSSILFINVYFPVTSHAKYDEYIVCLFILSPILESHEEDHVCILGDFNATPGFPLFNEICDVLHENNVIMSVGVPTLQIKIQSDDLVLFDVVCQLQRW